MKRILEILVFISINIGCKSQTNQNMPVIPEGKNRLALATSPYLLQHDENPVDWYEWGDEAFAKAKKEDKPVLVSIGYSSCHWCHVMAHESFEDSSVAAIMNQHFVNIKLDREERPDVDQIYMNAVQAMGLNGGWPLNVFVTPDQKPFYGGTYFPKQKWVEILTAIDRAFKENRQKLEESAENFSSHIAKSEIEKYGLTKNEEAITQQDFQVSYGQLSKKFDPRWGGVLKEPKFPMPATWNWIADYYLLTKDPKARQHLLFTLDKIAEGGIYDQIGGGFARYSVDDEWHVPHFEKMLYDNGQLLSLYAKAYQIQPNDAYLFTLEQTIEWLEREMLNESGGFYAALDADSEGVEGKFYVWSDKEVRALAGEHYEIISAYYDVSKKGNWEHTNVLRRLKSDQEVAERFGLSVADLRAIVRRFDQLALEKREERIRPGLDSKILSGWNGLLLSGLSKAHLVLKDEKSKSLAIDLANFISESMIVEGSLIRTMGKPKEGFLEDYAAVIKGFVDYYEMSFNEQYLFHAKALTEVVVSKFYDEEEELFFYTSADAESLIARKKELFDNVIPSSNAMMAENLYRLSIYFDNEAYQRLSQNMMNRVKDFVKKDPEFMAYWASTATSKLSRQLEISIIGNGCLQMARQLQATPRLNQVIMASTSTSQLPLMEHKTTKEGETTIYVCSEKTCRRPVTSVEEAMEEIELLIK